jgi:HTH-type transcriptional regulator/antitoxin HigA
MSHAITVRPIRTEQDFDAARERIASLMSAKPGTPADDELDVLLTLAQAYEHEHYPVGPADPVEAVRFAMDRLGLSQLDLVPYFGSKPRVSEFLHGKRRLTVETIRRLHDALGIPAESLIA